MSHSTQNKKNRFSKDYAKRGTKTGGLNGAFGFMPRTGGGVINEPRGRYTRDGNGHIKFIKE